MASAQSTRKSWRLRTRLAVGLTVLFAAIFALLAYSHFNYLDDRREARLEDLQRVSQTLAASFDGLVYDLESLALSTAITLGDANLVVDESVPEEARQGVNEYLGHLFDGHGLLLALFITDTDGTVVYDHDGSLFGRDVSDRDYIEALKGGVVDHWSEGFTGANTGGIVLTYSRKIINQAEETRGYLVVVVDSAALVSRVPKGVVGEGHFGIIDNNNNLVLFVPEDPNISPGASFADWSALDAARSAGSHVVRGESVPVAPTDAYGALIPMESRGWIVSYSLPASVVEGETTGLFLRDMALLGAIVLAAFIAVLFFADQMVRPISRLTEAAGAIARGEDRKDLLPAQTGNAEVKLLAETMAEMQNSIRTREEQLRMQNRMLYAIERLGETLASDLDLDRSITAVLDAGVEMIGAEAVQLLYRESGGRQRVAIRGSLPALALPEDHVIVRDVLNGKTSIGADPGPRSGVTGPQPRSVIGIPIFSRDGSQEGGILLISSRTAAFARQHERLARGLVRWASIALDNAKLFAESQEIVEDLARSNAAKDEFLGIVSHELRTPVTTIYGGTLLLRLRRESLPEQAFNDLVVSISEESERLHHLIEDLLAIARREGAGEKRPVDVNEALRTAIADFGTTHKREVTLELEEDLPEAMGDATYFRQVVTNLISNADKYSPKEEPIKISASLEGDDVVVRVIDKGPGVQDEDLPHIFDSFYRAKSATEVATGSGLGLTVSKRLIESLGGRIWARNHDDGGLEVGFTLEEVSSPTPAPVVNGSTSVAEPANGTAEAHSPSNGHSP